ncbi:MAG: hypothetical protein V4628_05235 [Pseudomonadota bacterium]
MLDEHKSLQKFYKTIGHELDQKVVARKDGVTLHGNFSITQLQLIMEAYETYRTTFNVERCDFKLLG